jgi:murein DD-endopeptidase MepM/ murein hydrolase activator NlpD
MRFADTRNKDGYSSRHIVLEVDDPNDGLMYLVHLHLDSIDGTVTPGANVVQGQEIGTVGDDGATYSHLSSFCKARPIPRHKPVVTR